MIVGRLNPITMEQTRTVVDDRPILATIRAERIAAELAAASTKPPKKIRKLRAGKNVK